jgi:hypothetical protein
LEFIDEMKRIFLCGFMIVISVLVPIGANAVDKPVNEKIEFWNEQRKGANYFSVNPDETWFAAARNLGVSWVRMTYAKWTGEQRDFLVGNLDNYQGLVEADVKKLLQVLDWAHAHQIKVVVVPLSLPGNRWVQQNDQKLDLRLWNDKKYWQAAGQFWRDLAGVLKDHPAVYAYNLINEPIPEMRTGLAEHGDPQRFIGWYQQHQNSARDLPAFYTRLIGAIRDVDAFTPIMLDAGWYAQPNAFTYWPALNDENLLYAFHMYEPYEFTNLKNFKEKKGYRYPGDIPFNGAAIAWDKQRLNDYLEPMLRWAKQQNIPANRIVAGEFGCYRRNPGCAEYLGDLIDIFNRKQFHWAFYSFREDEWDGFDYEVGTGELGWKYWQAVEEGKHPPPPRGDNPLFQIIKKEFKQSVDQPLN